MITEKSQHSQAAPQNNKPEGKQRTLTDSDVEELISFFQLLREWDREYQLKVVQEGKKP